MARGGTEDGGTTEGTAGAGSGRGGAGRGPTAGVSVGEDVPAARRRWRLRVLLERAVAGRDCARGTGEKAPADTTGGGGTGEAADGRAGQTDRDGGWCTSTTVCPRVQAV